MFRLHTLAVPCILLAVAISGCGSNSRTASAGTASQSSPQSASSASTSASTSSAGTKTSSSAGVGALSADAHSAATGDIPDNQVFLVYSNRAAGFSMKYPEGWTELRAGHGVTFSNKNNLVRVIIGHGAAPTPASVSAELKSAQAKNPTLMFSAPAAIRLPAGPGVKTVYTTESAPNPVTGKRVKLVVDRYTFAKGHGVAVVDLGTPKGVDNVDAYRMMIDSFQWQ